jgi:hypothetical protein
MVFFLLFLSKFLILYLLLFQICSLKMASIAEQPKICFPTEKKLFMSSYYPSLLLQDIFLLFPLSVTDVFSIYIRMELLCVVLFFVVGLVGSCEMQIKDMFGDTVSG